MLRKYTPFFLFLLFALPVAAQNNTLFRLVPTKNSHLHYLGQSVTQVIEGGGVAVGDINNDGLLDIFFTGDSLNALYLNKGNLVFEDITAKAGIQPRKSSTGVTMGDVNNDGFLDILISRETMYSPDSPMPKDRDGKDTCNVILYINNGNGTFTDRAKEYGILTDQILRQGTFLDIDKDNRLDIYLDGSYVYKRNIYMLQTPNAAKKGLKFNPAYLYKNIDGKHFQNIIHESGINFEDNAHFVLNVFASDIDQDGWTDIYANSDFDAPDYLFKNNHDNTFTDIASKAFRHTSYYTMGVDIADINNDGLLDIYATDMRPITNFAQKGSRFESSLEKELLISNNGRTKETIRQHVKNTLQLNRGNGQFSEIAELAGLDATEWSWAPLIADFDNDGQKDVFVANGLANFMNFQFDLPLLIDSLRRANPNVPVDQRSKYMRKMLSMDKNARPQYVNCIFKNNGDLTFTDKKNEWGMGKAVNSNGAAYGDLDNDGDLDMVVNNRSAEPYLYENQSNKQPGNHYLRVQLVRENHYPIESSTATIYYGDKLQFLELQPTRGFYSCSERTLHFGLGSQAVVDSLVVKWPDGKRQTITKVNADQVLTVNYKNALPGKPVSNEVPAATLLTEENNTGINFHQSENDFIDFRINPLQCNQYSKNGPGLAIGDLNNDGQDDVLIGGAVSQPRGLFLQDPKGDTFTAAENAISRDTAYEDEGILILDVNNDGFNDVVVASGGNEFRDTSARYTHRVYYGSKDGFTRKDINGIRSSASCVVAADYDNDGDMDLFIGSRITAQGYPALPTSYLLKNNKGSFTDVTAAVAPGLSKVGMVTSALFTDYNNDGKTDLIVVGECMPVSFFKNKNGKFVADNANLKFNIKTNGYWNSITGGDFDNDGDIDYVAGNLGLNTRYKPTQQYPLQAYAYDFDENGSLDIITTFYESGKQYPTKQLNLLAPRINGLNKKFYRTSSFATASISELFDTSLINKSQVLTSYTCTSTYIENKGNGSFEFHDLPIMAQIAPVNGIVARDVNNDGNLDLLLVGNFYYPEIERGKYDAFKGLCLLGDGKGGFADVNINKAGFYVERDARSLGILSAKSGRSYVIATQNNDVAKVFSFNLEKGGKVVRVGAKEKYALITLPGGKIRKEEFYYGSGYLSQSSRVLYLPKEDSAYKLVH